VLCERENNLRVVKGFVVKEVGGMEIILYNTTVDGEGLIFYPHLSPIVVVVSVVGDLIHRYILSKQNPIVAITFHGNKLEVKPAPVMASFSVKGPNPETLIF
jgi:hypothetical protein